MPLQGHWARQNAPVLGSSSREARVLLVATAASLLATIAIVCAVLLSEGSHAAPGCKRHER